MHRARQQLCTTDFIANASPRSVHAIHANTKEDTAAMMDAYRQVCQQACPVPRNHRHKSPLTVGASLHDCFAANFHHVVIQSPTWCSLHIAASPLRLLAEPPRWLPLVSHNWGSRRRLSWQPAFARLARLPKAEYTQAPPAGRALQLCGRFWLQLTCLRVRSISFCLGNLHQSCLSILPAAEVVCRRQSVRAVRQSVPFGKQVASPQHSSASSNKSRAAGVTRKK